MSKRVPKISAIIYRAIK